jgi:hypothetical protein
VKGKEFERMKMLSFYLGELSSHLSTLILVAEVEKSGGKNLVEFVNKINVEINEIIVWINLASKNEKKSMELLEFLLQNCMLPSLIKKIEMLYKLVL